MSSKAIKGNDEIIVYEINPTLPEREITMRNTTAWRRTYIGFFTLLFGSMFLALIFVLLFFIAQSIG